MKKMISFIILFLISGGIIFAVTMDLLIKPVDSDRLKFFPVTEDNKNYFFLQSINNVTRIIIGDFTQPEKRIVMITLDKDYTTIKSVTEYIPETDEVRTLNESVSKFFTTDVNKLKRDIITGTIFKQNYTDTMQSLSALESVLKRKDSHSIFPDVYGFSVKYSDVDDRKKHSAIFSYGKAIKGYYLIFKTEFYRESFVSTRIPVLKYSVYCKDTNDPVIQETVENLFKLKAPVASKAK